MEKLRRNKRKILAVIFVGFMVFITIGTMSWISELNRGPIQTLYQSPEIGETVEIGEWKYGEFHSPAASEVLGVTIKIEVIDWENAPSELCFVCGCNVMTMAEFSHLTDSEIYSELRCINETRYSNSTGRAFGVGFRLSENFDYIWAFRFLDVEGNVISGSLQITTTVSIDELLE